MQHVSYAAWLQEHPSGALAPAFEQQTVLAPDNLRRWTEIPNYIGHPAPFYLVVAQVLWRDLPLHTAILIARIASTALLWVGLAAVLAAGWTSYRQHGRALLTFSLAVVFCPKMFAIASQVTNDSLAVLGGSLAYAGAVRWRRSPGRAHWWVFVGFVLAAWAKPNAGFVVGLWLGWFLAMQPEWRRTLPLFAAAGLLGGLPYLPILWRYGALVPVSIEQLGLVRHEQLGSFGAYLPAFFGILGSSWTASGNGSGIAVTAFWIMMGSIMVVGWRARRLPLAMRVIPVSASAAFVLALPVHLLFASTQLGYSLPAASFRYYLPLWPALAHTLASGIAAGPPRVGILLTYVAVGSITIGWLTL